MQGLWVPVGIGESTQSLETVLISQLESCPVLVTKRKRESSLTSRQLNRLWERSTFDSGTGRNSRGRVCICRSMSPCTGQTQRCKRNTQRTNSHLLEPTDIRILCGTLSIWIVLLTHLQQLTIKQLRLQ